MKIKIKETGELKELSIVDPKTGIPFTGDFIGNTGATSDGQFTFNHDEGVYLCSEETFAWWESCIAAHQVLQDRIHELEQKHGSDSVHEVLVAAGGGDLEDEPKVILAALNEEFGKPIKNSMITKKEAAPSFGYRTWNVEGVCDGEKFTFDRLPENIPGGGMSDEEIFAAVRHERQRQIIVQKVWGK